jgi:hypothetical protein
MKRRKPVPTKRSRPSGAARKTPRAAPAIADPVMPLELEGGCHCGAIAYSYRTSIPPRRWSVRQCQCRFCRAHGVRSTSDPVGEISFRFDRPEFLRRYRFALRTADFLICKECGTFVAAVMLSGRGASGVINLNTLRAVPPGTPEGKPVNLDDESVEQRKARRVAVWTPVVGPV